ncbi:MAG: 5'-3' exonuclease H3TH domain-containing protein [Candidatus Margulisiibacteriota bacterium]|jgi:DNA polymerase-1
MPNKMVIIDGHSLAYRAFYALPQTLMDKTGQTTNVIHGFLKMIMRIDKEKQPRSLAVAFDTKAPTFRHIEYKEYKAHRPPSPPGFYTQLPILQEILAKIGVTVFAIDGYEADDVLATLAVKGENIGLDVTIISGDKDVLQLVTEKISVLMPIRGLSEMTEYTAQNFTEKTSLTPQQIVDYKSMKGDPSDNIPGVKGIGEKTAIQLLQKYGSLEEILKRGDLPHKVQEKINAGREIAQHNIWLTTLDRSVPLPESDVFQYDGLHFDLAAELLEKHSLRSVLNSVWNVKDANSADRGRQNAELAKVEVSAVVEDKEEQMSLF